MPLETDWPKMRIFVSISHSGIRMHTYLIINWVFPEHARASIFSGFVTSVGIYDNIHAENNDLASLTAFHQVICSDVAYAITSLISALYEKF